MANKQLLLSPNTPLHSARELVKCQYTNTNARTLHNLRNSWYLWTGTHYIEIDRAEIRATAYKVLDSAKSKVGNKWLPFHPTRAKVADVMEALQAEVQLPGKVNGPAWLDGGQDPPANEMLVCSNGVLHLPTLHLCSHSPALFTFNALDYAYDPDASEPCQWLQFLDSLWSNDHESIHTFQEMCGLLLTGDTRFQKIFMIVGPPRSGKGTIGRVLTALLGDSNVVNPSLSGLCTQFGLQELIGKQLAIISDARMGTRTDAHRVAEKLLNISGEDAVTIDRKYKGAWIGRLSARFVVLTNELPRLADASGALSSRFIVLTMHNSFLGKEDQGLIGKLLTEMPGILNWAIVGLRQLAERGHFDPPESSQQVTEELEDLGSPVKAFIREQCAFGPDLQVECGILFAAWMKWCGERNIKSGDAPNFGRELKAAAAPSLKTVQRRDEQGRPERYYLGLDLLPPKEV